MMGFLGTVEVVFTALGCLYIFVILFDACYDILWSLRQRRKAKRQA